MRRDLHVDSTLFKHSTELVHGTPGGYKRCRCRPCTDAAVRWERRYRLWRSQTGLNRLQPALGSRRRLLALAWIGYSQRTLARHIGCTDRTVHRICALGQTEINIVTATAIARVFDDLCTVIPYEDGNARKSMAWARRQPDAADPLSWDDDLIDLPLPIGRPRDLDGGTSQQDKARAFVEDVEFMHRTGRTLHAIAAHYRVTPKAIIRRLENNDAADLARDLTGYAPMPASVEEEAS